MSPGLDPQPPRRGRPRRDAAEQLYRDLLIRALDHFLDKGFDGTTLSAITASLGMSKRTIYFRYNDKLDLFQAAVKNAVDEWLQAFEGLPELETDDLEATLVRIARFIVDNLTSPSGIRLIRITNTESHRLPGIGSELYERGHRAITSFLGELLSRRLFGDGIAAADLDNYCTAFLHLMSGPARLNAWGLESGDLDLDRFVRLRVRLFLHGVRSDGS